MNLKRLNLFSLENRPKLIFSVLIGAFCGFMAVIVFLLTSANTDYREPKNIRLLKHKIHFKTDCPLDRIEITDKFDDLRAVKVKACGKVLKYSYHSQIGGSAAWVKE